jgi:hypothetical protein
MKLVNHLNSHTLCNLVKDNFILLNLHKMCSNHMDLQAKIINYIDIINLLRMK